METALSYLTVLPQTKGEVLSFANQILANVESGNLNALELKSRLKWIEKLIEAIDKPLKESVLKEAMKYEKSFDYKGWKVEQAELGTKYDYTKDAVWNSLEAEENRASELRKERELFLKSLKEKVSVVDELTGEVTECYPPIKTSSTGLRFTAL